MMLTLLNSICYTVGWFWCVFFGMHGRFFVALGGALFLIFLQLFAAKKKDNSIFIQDFLLVVFSIPLGTMLELLFIQTNLVQYMNGSAYFPPLWIILLYPLFSLQINHSLKMLKRSAAASFLFGFFGAPLSYIAGYSLGALVFPFPIIATWVIVGTCWGFFLWLIISLAKSIEKATYETLAEYNSNIAVELLYDGECPICQREICMLQKKASQAKVKFTDISSIEFLSSGCKVDYNSAMSQMHAIDSQGKMLVGLSAFAAVYARCKLLILSTCLRIPFLKKILEPLYAVFAKNRLWITRREKSKRGNK